MISSMGLGSDCPSMPPWSRNMSCMDSLSFVENSRSKEVVPAYVVINTGVPFPSTL